jgi:hypothetical protein
MKWFLMVMVAVVVWGCVPASTYREQYIDTQCTVSTDDLFQQMSAYFLTNNWNLIKYDTQLGFLEAHSNETFLQSIYPTGPLYLHRPKWTIQAVDNYLVDSTVSPIRTEKRGKKIIAICTAIEKEGGLNSTKPTSEGRWFYSDSTSRIPQFDFYWETRKHFESICGKISFVDRYKAKKSK